MKTFIFILLFAAFLTVKGCAPIRENGYSAVYDDWPGVSFRDVRVLIASEPGLANKGFAPAEHKDFEKTIMIFPGIEEGTVFVNHNQGYGAVAMDLKIVFLDSEMKVLKTDIMRKGDGFSVAPPGTAFAIEGLPPR